MHVHQGYILAKAIRITDISQPDNNEIFELQEIIKTDDIISSFILKACLFENNRHKIELDKCLSPHDVTTTIYELLHQCLIKKKIESNYSGECPVDCEHCELERGCCKRRRLMLAMVENIIQCQRQLCCIY